MILLDHTLFPAHFSCYIYLVISALEMVFTVMMSGVITYFFIALLKHTMLGLFIISNGMSCVFDGHCTMKLLLT